MPSLHPALYAVLLFLFAVAAAVVLPIPVEPLLAFGDVDPLVKVIVVGLGKGFGAIAVFYVGTKVNPWLERWMLRHGSVQRILKGLEWFVRRTGWVGLLVLLAIPFMSDTAVNYFYALLNEKGEAVSRPTFVVANVIGGVLRAAIFLWLLP